MKVGEVVVIRIELKDPAMTQQSVRDEFWVRVMRRRISAAETQETEIEASGTSQSRWEIG